MMLDKQIFFGELVNLMELFRMDLSPDNQAIYYEVVADLEGNSVLDAMRKMRRQARREDRPPLPGDLRDAVKALIKDTTPAPKALSPVTDAQWAEGASAIRAILTDLEAQHRLRPGLLSRPTRSTKR